MQKPRLRGQRALNQPRHSGRGTYARGLVNALNEPTLAAGLRAGLRLEAVSIAWMVVEAGVSVGAGIAAGSLLLVAFGADSVIELVSAFLLFWRLRRQALGQLPDEESVEALERKVSRVAGYLLYVLSLYVIAQAAYGLTHRHQAETSWPGIGIALAAAFGMPLLAKAKIHVADQIGSRALHADAMETFTCGYLSWALLAGLAVNAAFHWWWLDSAAALAIVPLLIKEGREAVTGECHCPSDE